MSEESIDVLGKWWLPETPDRKVTGVLTYDSEEGAKLRLHDALRGSDVLSEVASAGSSAAQHASIYPRIVGEAEGRGYTLEDCFRTRLQGFFSSGGAAETIHVNAVFRGIMFEPGEALEFTAAFVGLTQLTAWSGINGLASERPSPGGEHGDDLWHVVRASRTPEIMAEVDGATVELAQYLTTKDNAPHNVTIAQEARVRVVFDDQLRPLKDFVALVNDVQDLVTIATGTTAAKDSFQVTHPSCRGSIDYFVRWNNKPVTEERLHAAAMPFTFADLGVTGLESWLRMASKFRTEVRRIMATKYQRSMYLEDRAQNIMAAIESIARYPKKDRKFLIDHIKACIREVGEPFLTLIGDDIDGWAREAKERRNDLAHHRDGALAPASETGQLTREMYWLAVLLLLRRAEAPAAVFERIARSAEFGWLVEQHAAQRGAAPA